MTSEQLAQRESGAEPLVQAVVRWRSFVSACVALVSVTFVGCATPTPQLAGGANPEYHTVQVFFATDRAPDPAARAGYGGERGALVYGTVDASVPFGHRMGEVDKPKWYVLFGRENPALYMTILASQTVDADAFFKLVQEASRKSGPGGSAFIFVHGYNVSFEDAALRTAQMANDLDLDAVPVFYSWPSKGQEAAYIADEDAASWTVYDLRRFLEAFADRSNAGSIYIIAHSMGARAATRALTSLVEHRSDLAARFSEIVLAAPDIDADEFRRDIAPRFAAAREPVTLYASSRDKALAVSKAIHQDEERAGQTVPHAVIVKGVETIDASAVDTDWLGHSYFVEQRTLLTDMTLLLKNKLQAAKRPGLVAVPLTDTVYWAFRP